MKTGARSRLSPILLFGAASLLTAQAFSVQEFPQIFGKPQGIVAGPDGNLWFTENGLNRIGQVTTAGDVKESVIPSPSTLPDGIAVGPDANIWFTEAGGNRVGRVLTGISPPPTPTPTPGGLRVVPRHGTPAPRPFRTP